MPDTAFVSGQGLCPTCGTLVLNRVRCQWGVVPGKKYEIGDSVSWLCNEKGEIIPPFRLCQISPDKWKWNCGDPQYRNVILFEARRR